MRGNRHPLRPLATSKPECQFPKKNLYTKSRPDSREAHSTHREAIQSSTFGTFLPNISLRCAATPHRPRAGVRFDDEQSRDPHTPCDDVADMECGHYKRVAFEGRALRQARQCGSHGSPLQSNHMQKKMADMTIGHFMVSFCYTRFILRPVQAVRGCLLSCPRALFSVRSVCAHFPRGRAGIS